MKKHKLSVLAVLIFVLCTSAGCAQLFPSGRERDNEFAAGTQIHLTALSNLQHESLYKLCKVWGFTKYYHPSVIDGSLNWDAELFRIMPKILDAENAEETNSRLFLWLAQFPCAAEQPEDAQNWIDLQELHGHEDPDTEWIHDDTLYGAQLTAYLETLSRLCISDRSNAYGAFAKPEEPYVNFDQELFFPLNMEDDGAKLLGLFRFWNMYEYYSPYLSLTDKPWDLVLKEAISDVAAAKTYRDYVLAIAHAAAQTKDAHISISDRQNTLLCYYGERFLPCTFQSIDGNPVISAVSEDASGLLPGDTLCAIDGVPIKERIHTLSQYTALPSPDKFAFCLRYSLLASANEQAEVEILRDGIPRALSVKTSGKPFVFENPRHNGLIENEQIGYLDPSTLKEGDAEKLMQQFQHTKGIILDLRYYPSVFLPYLLGDYLIPEPKQFALLTQPNRAIPGAFYTNDNFYTGAGSAALTSDKQTPPLYRGKVILLMDETSMSQSEFTIMALRQSPNAMVVGSPSLGADGNVINFRLPGNIAMRFTGLGVYTPEGAQTQCVGLQPDVLCLPTVNGLSESRDELIEKAISLILE